MEDVPVFLQGTQITLTRTENGFAISANKNDPIETIVAFDTWDDCTFYLTGNFAPDPAP